MLWRSNGMSGLAWKVGEQGMGIYATQYVHNIGILAQGSVIVADMNVGWGVARVMEPFCSIDVPCWHSGGRADSSLPTSQFNACFHLGFLKDLSLHLLMLCISLASSTFSSIPCPTCPSTRPHKDIYLLLTTSQVVRFWLLLHVDEIRSSLHRGRFPWLSLSPSPP